MVGGCIVALITDAGSRDILIGIGYLIGWTGIA